MIALARAGPTPGSLSSSSADAELISNNSPDGMGLGAHWLLRPAREPMGSRAIWMVMPSVPTPAARELCSTRSHPDNVLLSSSLSIKHLQYRRGAAASPHPRRAGSPDGVADSR